MLASGLLMFRELPVCLSLDDVAIQPAVLCHPWLNLPEHPVRFSLSISPGTVSRVSVLCAGCLVLLLLFVPGRQAARAQVFPHQSPPVVAAGWAAQGPPAELHDLPAHHALPAQLVHQHHGTRHRRAHRPLLPGHLCRCCAAVICGHPGRHHAAPAEFIQGCRLLVVGLRAGCLRPALPAPSDLQGQAQAESALVVSSSFSSPLPPQGTPLSCLPISLCSFSLLQFTRNVPHSYCEH